MIQHGMSQQPQMHERRCDLRLCKTCKELGVANPKIARTEYSDCEEHYRKRLNPPAKKSNDLAGALKTETKSLSTIEGNFSRNTYRARDGAKFQRRSESSK